MKKTFLKNLPNDILSLIKTMGSFADDKQISAYLVGGFVRDLILKRKNLDVDIVLETDAVLVAKILAKKWAARLVTHQQFGTASLFLPNGLRIDLSTARKEAYAFSGALPTVFKGELHDDLFRRDFTINAMAFCINKDRFGELVDDFGGLSDLREKKIRILHDKSFLDDPTRILRAVRFEQRFGFQLERKTHRLLAQALKKKMDRHVKPQRYFAEFKKILKESSPPRHLKRLNQFQGLNFISLLIKMDKALIALLARAEKNVAWFEISFSQEKQLDKWLVYFIILLSNLSLVERRKVAERFNLSRDDRNKINSLSSVHEKIAILRQKDLAPSQVYQILFPLSLEAILCLRSMAREKLIIQKIDDFLNEYRFVQLRVTGYDLEKIGIPPGQSMGAILSQLLSQKVDGSIKSYRDELKVARQLKNGV